MIANSGTTQTGFDTGLILVIISCHNDKFKVEADDAKKVPSFQGVQNGAER